MVQIHLLHPICAGAVEVSSQTLWFVEQRNSGHELTPALLIVAKTKNTEEPEQPSNDGITLRPIPDVPDDAVQLGEDEIRRQLADEDARVKQGLTRMGIKGDILDLSAAFRDFSRKHFSSAFEVVSGGITRQYMDVVAEIINIDNELAALSLKSKTTPDLNDLAREQTLREDRARLLDFSVKLYDRTLKAVLIAAKIKAMKKEREGDAGKPKGFLKLQAR